MPTATQVQCPACGRKQPERGPAAIYYCDNCRGMFDGEPGEGGDFDDRHPDRRLIREENRQQRKRR